MIFSLNDKEIKEIIAKEARRQQAGVELILLENFVSEEVLQIQGSILQTNMLKAILATAIMVVVSLLMKLSVLQSNMYVNYLM